MRRSLLLIGIDGATWRVLRPVMERGHMPFLADVVDRGSHGILKSTIPAITPVAWSAFQTGLNPGNLGIDGWRKWRRGADKPTVVGTSSIGKTLWEICSDNDLKVATVNVPMTYPPRPINGCMVSGLLTPSIKSDFVYPPEMRQRLLEAVPGYDFFRGANGPDNVTRSELGSFLDSMADMAENRGAGARFIINEGGPWDLVMVHFLVGDYVEHRVWNFLDETHPAYDAGAFDAICRRFFETLDREISSIWADFQQNAAGEPGVMFLSDHGQQPNMKAFNVVRWLREEGFLQLRETVSRTVGRLWSALRWIDPLRIRHLIPGRVRRSAAHRVGLVDLFDFIDRQNTRAIVFQGLMEAGLHILPDPDSPLHASTRAEIVERLLGLRDPSTGEAVVRAVHRREDIWQGRLLAEMPELVIELEDGYSFAFDRNENAPLFRDIIPGKDRHVGTHHKDGIVAAAGPGFRSGEDLACELIDLSPTILDYLGVSAAAPFDGQVVSAMLEAPHNYTFEVAQSDDTDAPHEEPQTRSTADEEAVKQRLRDLGYL